MRHTFLVVTVKRWLKSVYINGSYCKIKTGVPLFLDHPVKFMKGFSRKETLKNSRVARHAHVLPSHGEVTVVIRCVLTN